MINLCRAACAAPKGLSRGCQAARRQLAAAGLPESERSQLGEGPVLLWRTRSYAGTSAGNLRCPGRSSLTAPTRPPPVPRQPGPLASHRRGQAFLSALSSARAYPHLHCTISFLLTPAKRAAYDRASADTAATAKDTERRGRGRSRA